MFLNITEIHLLWVSGADAEVWNVSIPCKEPQNSSTESGSTSQVLKGLSHLADTSTVGTEFLDKASGDRMQCELRYIT